MEVKIKKLPKNETELTIEIPANEFDVFLKQTEETFYQNFETAGFRKGKAPKEIFKREVDEKKIYEEAARTTVESTMREALQQEKVEAVGLPKIEIMKLSLGNPFVYKMTFSALPKVKICNLKKIEVARKKIEIVDKEINQMLDEIRLRRRKEKIIERTAEKGDKVEIDFELFFGTVPVENGQAKKVPYVIGEKSWLPDLEKHLIGAKRGEAKEFSLTYPEDYFDKKLAGREVNFKVKINNVYEIELSEINDEFAKSLGDFKDLDDLKNKLKINLSEEKKQKNEELLELNILNQIVEKSEFEEIPEMLLEEEAHKMLHELEDNLAQQNLKFEDYLSHLKKTKDDLERELKPQAGKRVKTILIIRDLIKGNKIFVEDKELEDELEKIKEHYNYDPSLQKNLQTPEYKNYLRNMMSNRKTIEFIKGQVKIIE